MSHPIKGGISVVLSQKNTTGMGNASKTNNSLEKITAFWGAAGSGALE